jgi:hypothetical protein
LVITLLQLSKKFNSLTIPGDSPISKSDDQNYYLYNEKEFLCGAEHCMTLDTLLKQQMYTLLEFSHQEEDGEPLLLTQIKCSTGII